MNTTPEQLRLAADLKERNQPYQYGSQNGGEWVDCDDWSCLFEIWKDGFVIRPKPASFPPKPEGMEFHNPDNLTAEQVGDGWRLCVVGEIQSKGYQYYHKVNWISGVNTEWTCEACNPHMSVRVPISTPYPDGSYVKDGQLVKPWVPKFKVGDRVQMVRGTHCGIVKEFSEEHKTVRVEWSPNVTQWEIEDGLEPYIWRLSRHIHNFRPLRDGEEWHCGNQPWIESDLPSGYRPVLVGEETKAGDDCWSGGLGPWSTKHSDGGPLGSGCTKFRTTRPLPEPPKRVPLGLDDAPAGSLFRHPNHPDIAYTPLQISGGGIVTYNGHDHAFDIGEYPKDGGGKAGVWHRSWETLQNDSWQIHRPGNLDANGKPVWEPCHKPA